MYNCQNVIDFGIYQQAIYDIWTKFELNPYISVRHIKIFNDHFDPIVYLAAVFVGIVGQNPVSVILFESSYWVIDFLR